MTEKKKKIFPKIKKQIKDFLTDESWEITKKDALGMSAGAALLAWTESVNADTLESKTFNFSKWTVNHSNSISRDDTAYCQVNANIIANVKAKHVSWIINWHISKNPEVTIDMGEVGNSIHGSHSSWGWC